VRKRTRHRLHLEVLFLSLFAGVGASARVDAQDAIWGATVVTVAYASDGPVDAQDVARLAAVRAGEPLTEAASAATVRNLFATRQFADVRIDAVAADGGVSVRILLFRAYRIYPIRFSGRRGVSAEELRRSLPFFAGSVYSEEDVQDGVGTVERRFVAEGFPRARVRADTEFDRKRFEARVTYRIDAGERALVADPILQGSLEPFRAEDLLGRAKLKPGDRYREAKALADATRMREVLHEKGRLKAEVELIAAQPTEDGRISPVYRVFVGPEVVFEVTGIPEKKVRKEIHELLEGQVFDEDLVLQYAENQKARLQNKGYFRATVDYALDTRVERVTVKITAVPGKRYSVEDIQFLGNASVSDKTLGKLMVTTPRGLPIARPGRLTDQELREDVNAILGWYQARGWIGAKVGPPDVVEGSKPDRLLVRIPIEEGVRTVVEHRTLDGAEHAHAEELEKLLSIRIGQPFDPNRLRADVSAIQQYYRNRGWLEASVRDEYRLTDDNTRVDVTYLIVEGTRSFFGKTIVRGNVVSRTERIRRLATWTEGAPFSEEPLLEAQRGLSRTAAFRRVEVKPEAPDPADHERNVLIELQEGSPLSLLYGFGYQYVPDAGENRNDPFLVGGVSTRNLFGGLRSTGLEGQIALSGRYRIQLSYRDPFLIQNDYPLTSVLFASRETIQNVNLERFGFVTEVSRVFGRYLRTSFRTEYQSIRPLNPDEFSVVELPRADQPIEEATVGPAFFYDRRDDPIDPHRGYYVSLAGKYAFPLFAAEARYTKFALQGTWFQPLGRAVFAVSGRWGGIFPYGPSDIPVPIAERFFVGGRSTGRAFETDLLGIPLDLSAPDGAPGSPGNATADFTTQAVPSQTPGQGNCPDLFVNHANYDCHSGPRIIGGNGFLSLNAELRFPIAGNLGGVVFYDAAQVWSRFGSVKLAFEGADGLRQGAGAGLFYMLPIGPLRAEYSWKLTRRLLPTDIVDVTPNQPPTVLLQRQELESPGQFYVSIGFPF
jgi:outer membrane protein insertion porin family